MAPTQVATPFTNLQKESKGVPHLVAWSRLRFGPPPSPPLPVVICGPSGVGKGTLIAKLMAEFPARLGFSVSHTTRLPRPGEVDGIHYNFTTRPEMEAGVEANQFLEYADVHGNLYGSSEDAVRKVMESGKVTREGGCGGVRLGFRWEAGRQLS